MKNEWVVIFYYLFLLLKLIACFVLILQLSLEFSTVSFFLKRFIHVSRLGFGVYVEDVAYFIKSLLT